MSGETLAGGAQDKQSISKFTKYNVPEMLIIRELYQSGCLIKRLELNRRKKSMQISCARPIILFSPEGCKVIRLSGDYPIVYETLEECVVAIAGYESGDEDFNTLTILSRYLSKATMSQVSATIWLQGDRYVLMARPIHAKGGWQASLIPIADHKVMPSSSIALHDLKTALNQLLFIDCITTPEKLDELTPYIYSALDLIRKQLKCMEAIRDKVELEENHVTKLSALIESLSDMALAKHRPSVKIESDLSGSTRELLVRASLDHFHIAFEQMIENAQQHNANSVTISFSRDNHFVNIKVWDNGDGMSAEVLQELRRHEGGGIYVINDWLGNDPPVPFFRFFHELRYTEPGR